MTSEPSDGPRSRAGVPDLVAVLIDRIRRDGPLSFSEFMDAALYHPEHGYYASGAVGLGGPGADFRTSPEVHPLFGELLARQIVEMYVHLGRPQPFRLVELGPGTGRLAATLLARVRELLPAESEGWDVHLVERSASLARAQRARLTGPSAALGDRIAWSSAEELAAQPADGVVLSNEFFDALTVRRVQRRDGCLQEMYVDWSDTDGFVPVLRPEPSGSLADYLSRYGDVLAEGQVAELGLEALGWMDRLAALLRRGYILTIDYGDEAAGLYGPKRRAGSLMAYRGHRALQDPWRDVGAQDLTAHVNFTALVRRGQEHGFRAAPLRTQTEFLLALGILDRMSEREERAGGEVERWQDRLAAKELFAPGGMGETFRVLVQAREAPLELLGLTSPWRS